MQMKIWNLIKFIISITIVLLYLNLLLSNSLKICFESKFD